MQSDVVDSRETQSLTHWTSISSLCHTAIVIDSLNVNCCKLLEEGVREEHSQKQQQSYCVACPRVHGRHATVAASLPTALQLQLMGTATKTTNKKFLKLGIVRHRHTHRTFVCVCMGLCVVLCSCRRHETNLVATRSRCSIDDPLQESEMKGEVRRGETTGRGSCC